MSDKCWLCLRTSVEKILEVSRQLFRDDVETSHKIGLKAAELLKQAYLKNPPSLCGKSTKGLIAAALYVACILERKWKTQREVAEVLDFTETGLRTRYRHLLSILDIEDQVLISYQTWTGETYYRPIAPWGKEYDSAEGNH